MKRRAMAAGSCVLLALVAVSACGRLSPSAPDLERLYAHGRRGSRYPVVVVPGVMGTRLREARGGREEWPGGLWNLVTGDRFDALALPVGSLDFARNVDDLEPSGFFSEFVGEDYYGEIVRTLTGPGGYRCAAEDELTADSDCVLLAWDWRRDLVEAAGRLGEAIERIRRLRGDPDLKVDVIAHSAGGLVARYFVRFGARDVLERSDPEAALDTSAARAIRRVVLVGTPNYGSVSALQRAIMGNDLGPGLATMPPEVLATMPSLFELLPNPARTWMIDVHGARLEVDLYDPDTWRRYGWSIFDPSVRQRIARTVGSAAAATADLADRERFFAAALERARRFHRALSAPLAAVPSEYIVFGGDCTLTPARCLVETVDGKVRIRLHPDEVTARVPGVDYERLMLEPGDGRVTKASLLARDTLDPEAPQPGFFPIAYAVFICREHASLPSDITFRDNLLNVLLY